MQVRSVEFQENFRLVTLEASRQQSVLNREGSEGIQNAAAALSDERALQLERPNPTPDSEPERLIDEKAGQRSERRSNRPLLEEASDQESEETAGPERGLLTGQSIDLLA